MMKRLAAIILAVGLLFTLPAGVSSAKCPPSSNNPRCQIVPTPTPTITPTATPTIIPTPTPTVTPTPTPTATPTLTPSNPLVISGDNITIENKAFTGTTGVGYGIWAVGTASNHITNLTIRNSTFRGFQAAIWAGFVDNILIENVTIDNARYAGIMVLSATGGTIRGNTVRHIGQDQPALTNAYGIAISQQNPASDPLSIDVVVYNNVVEDIPTWEALDTHGGQRIIFRNNIVRYSRRGVMITSSSSSGIARDCIVDGNQFLSPVSNPSGDQYAVVLVQPNNTQVINNTITGWGTPDLTRAYLRINDTNTIISGNTVQP